MKVILLAGGRGSRISEQTDSIPKPMIEIGGKPILWHIMQIYANFSHNDFLIALGYKGEVIKDYFSRYHVLNSDFSVNLRSGKITPLRSETTDWDVTLVDTGVHSMTGGRVKRMKDFVEEKACMLTYGDGLADINIDELLSFHKSHGRLLTVTAVHPGARFGELEIDGDDVLSFQEKPQVKQGWINGGYFVIEPDFFDFISDDMTILEREPLEEVARAGEMKAYKHDGFWHCMDTKRDRDNLELMWRSGKAPWQR